MMIIFFLLGHLNNPVVYQMIQTFSHDVIICIPILEELVPPSKQEIPGDKFKPWCKSHT